MKLSSPSAQRNRGPILAVLAEWLPESGLVLEVASGSGEHAVHFAQAFPQLEWQPSDPDPGAILSIEAWRTDSGLANLHEPVILDATAETWPVERAEAVLNINMVHISPWGAALGLLAGGARVLPAGGPLILYGPWLKADIETMPSNLEFDAELKRRDPEWGLRWVEDFVAAAAQKGLKMEETRLMPANNLMLLFRRLPDAR